MKEIKKWEDISEILERYISENYISKRELEEEEIEHQQEIRWAKEEERKKIYTENGANSMCDYWYKKGKEEERDRIIEMCRKMEKDINYSVDLIDETKKALRWHQDAGWNLCLQDLVDKLNKI